MVYTYSFFGGLSFFAFNNAFCRAVLALAGVNGTRSNGSFNIHHYRVLKCKAYPAIATGNALGFQVGRGGISVIGNFCVKLHRYARH